MFLRTNACVSPSPHFAPVKYVAYPRAGNNQVVGRVVNNTQLECASPSVQVAGTVPVSVSFQFTKITQRTTGFAATGSLTSFTLDNILTFDFYPTEMVSGLEPYEGPARGGTTVSIRGSKFRNTTGLVVRFQSPGSSINATTATTDGMLLPYSVVPGRFVSDEEVMVQTPNCPTGSSGGFFSVGVSSNGEDFSPFEGPLFFYDANEPFVERVSPTILREGGGEILTIYGLDFPETYPSTILCTFGEDSVIPATRRSAEELSCLSPPHEPGTVAITVTSYGQSFASHYDILVEYVGALRVTSSSPTLGPSRGGTAVTVYGEGFHVKDEYLCAFGLTQPPTIATFVNASAIVCTAPALSRAEDQGQTTLVIRMNRNEGAYGDSAVAASGGQDAAMNVTDGGKNGLLLPLTFLYHNDINVMVLSPSTGPMSGGTAVRISGSGFLKLPQAACQFGRAEPIPARVIDEFTLVCTAASSVAAITGGDDSKIRHTMNLSIEDTGVPVTVTVNGVDFSSASFTAMFYYDQEVVLHALAPDHGPATGGMRVTIEGSGFRRDEHLACMFGLEVVPAEYFNNHQIACIAPPQSRFSVVSVSVTLNGQDFTPKPSAVGGVGVRGGPTFTYTARAVVTAVQPETGPSRGGTVVSIHGANFANTTMLRCKFGGVEQAVAHFVSREMVTCVSPAVPVGTGRVHLEVSDHYQATPSPSSSDYSIGTYADWLVEDATLWTNSGVEFSFTIDAQVRSAFPSAGPTSGGTRVSLVGSGMTTILCCLQNLMPVLHY